MGLRCLRTSIFIETPSLEGLPTKAKEDPSPREMRLSPAGHQFSISWSRGIIIFIIIMIIIVSFILIRKRFFSKSYLVIFTEIDYLDLYSSKRNKFFTLNWTKCIGYMDSVPLSWLVWTPCTCWYSRYALLNFMAGGLLEPALF